MDIPQISKKINDYYGSIIEPNPSTINHDADIFPFTRAEKIKLESLYSTKSIASTIIKEVPIGLINNDNDTFTLSRVPINTDFLTVYVNGIKRDVISLTKNKFSIGFAPLLGSKIDVIYFITTTVVDPSITNLNLDRLTNFYNAYMLTNNVLVDNTNDVITDSSGELIFTT